MAKSWAARFLLYQTKRAIAQIFMKEKNAMLRVLLIKQKNGEKSRSIY